MTQRTDTSDGAPQSCDLVLHGGHVVTLDSAQRVIPDGALAVQRGRILALGTTSEILARYRGRDQIDARGGVVHPGFIDAHSHVNQYAARSVLPLMAGSDVTMGHWKAALRPEDEAASVSLAALDYLQCGFTAFVDPGTLLEPDAAAAAATELGIRAWVADPYVGDQPQVLGDFAPELVSREFLALWPGSLDEAQARLGGQLFRNREPDALVRGFIGLYGEGTDSPALFGYARGLAREAGVQFQEHLGYLPRLQRCREAALGKALLRALDEMARLDEGVTFIHMNLLRQDDLSLLAARNARVIWCPYGQIAIGADDETESRMAALARAGVEVAIASDIARVSGFDGLGTLAALASRIAGETVTPQEILRMQTTGAAASIGAGDQIGSLEPGKLADVVIRTADASALLELCPSHELALLAGRDTVERVLVAGTTVVEAGSPTKAEAGRIVAAARRSVREIAGRIGLSAGGRFDPAPN